MEAKAADKNYFGVIFLRRIILIITKAFLWDPNTELVANGKRKLEAETKAPLFKGLTPHKEASVDFKHHDKDMEGSSRA